MISLKFLKMEGKYINGCYFKMIFLFEVFHNNVRETYKDV